MNNKYRYRFSIVMVLGLIIATFAFAAPSPVPKNLIPLDSPVGTALFNKSYKANYFWNLNLNFVAQDNVAYCSIASSVMVLNALKIPAPTDPQYPSYNMFTQINFFSKNVESVLPSTLVRKQGATLDQISRALATYPVTVKAIHTNESTINKFRQLAIDIIKNNKGYIIVNFTRPGLGEAGGGHMSPLAAYDKKTDRFLLLDVARYRYPSVWVKTQDLWDAMNTIDKDAKAYRGFIIVSQPPPAKPLVIGPHSMVVSNNPWASQAAQEMLTDGGNAVDAGIAAGFVLGLTEPQSSGIGGGGYALTYSAQTQKKLAYDGREVAPLTADPNWFLDKNGKPLALVPAVLSAKSVGVPGEVALFYKLHQDQGKLPWEKLLVPAIRLAKNGFQMSPLLHDFLGKHQFILKTNSEIKKIYFDGENIKPIGSLIKNAAYSSTLEKIAKNPKEFYQGKLAEEIIAAINRFAGKILFTPQDFKNYQIKIYPALCNSYRSDYQICSVPPSTSGGVTMLELLGIYALKFSGSDINDLNWQYYFFEASKLAFADRNQYIADPDFVRDPVSGLLSQNYLLQRSKLIGSTALATPVTAGLPEGADPRYAPDSGPKPHGTTSLAIVDKEGNAISLTVTIESPFGSHLFTQGFFLNNELTDFSFLPQTPQGKWIANRVQAGKRPRSSITPTMVFNTNHELTAVTGSPGGSAIICYVAKNLILMLDMHLLPDQASASPNLCAMNSTPVIEGIKNEISGVTNILRKPGGGWYGAADPRREGVAIGR